jgi:hypothetical protein
MAGTATWMPQKKLYTFFHPVFPLWVRDMLYQKEDIRAGHYYIFLLHKEWKTQKALKGQAK